MQFLRVLFATVARLYPFEHGKYSILTRVYDRFLKPSGPYEKVIRTSHGFKLRADLHEYVQAWIFCFGSYELPTVRFIRSYLKQDDVCFDIGGHIGYLSLVMATSANRSTTVVGFEPETENAKKYLANMELNSLQKVSLVEKQNRMRYVAMERTRKTEIDAFGKWK